MHYEKANERVPVTPTRPMNAPDYRHNSDIRKTRLILLILLAIQLIFSFYYFIQNCVDLSKYNNSPNRNEKFAGTYIGQLVASIFSLIYVAVFIFMVVKYIRLGVLIFAWLGLLELIFILIIVILAIVAVVGLSAYAQSAAIGIVGIIIILVVAIIGCLLMILIVVFAFRLAKLLRLQENYQTV